MMADLKALNEHWWVFAIMALGFAIVAFLIHRCLVKREGIKADFGQSNTNSSTLDDNESPNKKYSLEGEKSAAAKAKKELSKLFGMSKSNNKDEEEEKQIDSVYHSMPGERQSKPNDNHFPAHQNVTPQQTLNDFVTPVVQSQNTQKPSETVDIKSPQKSQGYQAPLADSQDLNEDILQPRDLIVDIGELETIDEEQLSADEGNPKSKNKKKTKKASAQKKKSDNTNDTGDVGLYAESAQSAGLLDMDFETS